MHTSRRRYPQRLQHPSQSVYLLLRSVGFSGTKKYKAVQGLYRGEDTAPPWSGKLVQGTAVYYGYPYVGILQGPEIREDGYNHPQRCHQESGNTDRCLYGGVQLRYLDALLRYLLTQRPYGGDSFAADLVALVAEKRRDLHRLRRGAGGFLRRRGDREKPGPGSGQLAAGRPGSR